MKTTRKHSAFHISRRGFLKLSLGFGVSLLVPGVSVAGEGASSIIKRRIPKTGEEIPVIGLGTARTFDVSTRKAREPLREVLRLFVEMGGTLVDTSPMYGNAETVIGDLADELGIVDSLFLATKVWTTGREAGIRQMEESMRRLKRDHIDLMQVHNLVDTQVHLDTLRSWKKEGRIRYLGVTHYRVSAYDELEKIMKTESIDFVQFNYSIQTTEAEKRLLPVAADTGTAVIINEPFEKGALFKKVKGKALPSWAKEFDCGSWAQFFLKYIVSHPSVTCVIPATSKPEHLKDNMQAGYGRLPDERMRKHMVDYLREL
ncbi:MAG: aldo/keto reductase [Deltaproteobacteria bacterium]|nr:MAG: aldo/keto reductase [Deltaproteobacteria bacterium]